MATADLFGTAGLGQLGGMLMNIMRIVGIAVGISAAISIMMVVAFKFFKPMLYNIPVIVWSKRHEKYTAVGFDKGKIKKIRSKFFGLVGKIQQVKFELLIRKQLLPTPPHDLIFPCDKRNSPGMVNLYKYGEIDYAGCDVTIEDGSGEGMAPKKSGVKYKYLSSELKEVNDDGSKLILKPVSTNLRTFYLQEMQESRERNSPVDWLARHQVIIAAGLVCIIIFVGFYAGHHYYKLVFEQGIGGLSTATKEFTETLQQLNSCRM